MGHPVSILLHLKCEIKAFTNIKMNTINPIQMLKSRGGLLDNLPNLLIKRPFVTGQEVAGEMVQKLGQLWRRFNR